MVNYFILVVRLIVSCFLVILSETEVLAIHPYSDNFPLIFRKEQQRLREILGNDCIIEHFGSTAIPKTPGKGIIDIMVGFSNWQNLQKAIPKLSKNGYILSKKDQNKRKNRVFLSTSGEKESCLGDIHLHLTLKNHPIFRDAMVFRDYLRQNSQLRQKYGKHKGDLIKRINGQRSDYAQLKGVFIKKVLKQIRTKV